MFMTSNTGNNQKNTGELYVISVEERYFSVSKALHIIIAELLKKTPLPAIKDRLNAEHVSQYLYTEETVQKVIQTKILPLRIFDENLEIIKNNPIPYIRFKRKLFSVSKAKILLGLLSPLFRDNFFKTLFVLLFLFNLFYYFVYGSFYTTPSSYHAPLFSFFTPACLIVIFFIHEFGHATAAYFNKLEAREIGIGLYFIFPVLYTDVTSIWKLPRKERIKVNLGGLYFQLITGFLLIILSLLCIRSVILKQIITANLVIVVYNLNPFFKFDGYWVYSDFFDLPNLHKQTSKHARELLRSGLSFLQTGSFSVTKKPGNIPLTLYTCIYYPFLFCVVLYLFRLLSGACKDVYGLLMNPPSWTNLFLSFKSILFVCMAVFLLFTFIKKMVRRLYQLKSPVYDTR